MSGVVDAVMNEIGENEIYAVAQRFGMSPEQAQGAIAQAVPLLVGAMARNTATPEGAQALHGALERDHSSVDLGGLLGGLFGGAGGGQPGAGGGIGDILGNVLGGGQPNAGGNAGGGIGDILGSVLGGAQAGGGAVAGGNAGGGLGDVLGSVLGGGSSGGGGIGGAILGHIFGSRQKQAADGLGQTTGLGTGNALQLLAMLAPVLMAVLGRMNRNQGLGPGGLGEVLGRDDQRARSGGGVTGGLLGAVLDRDGDGDVDLSDLLQVGGGLLSRR